MRIGVGYSTLDIDMPPSKIDFQQWQKTRETDSLAADRNFVTNNCLKLREIIAQTANISSFRRKNQTMQRRFTAQFQQAASMDLLT